MIGKIQPPNPNVENAVRYNERKMDGDIGIREHNDTVEEIENGHVLATRNVPDGVSMVDEFDRIKLENIKKRVSGPKIRNLTFHMSVNPSETDRPLSEAEAVSLIDEIMEGLGYKDQPYRIYKHTDIKRMHYHVVSTRAGADGKKINDSFERLVLRETLKRLAPKYGFSLVLTEEEIEKEQQKRSASETESINGGTPAIEIPEALVSKENRKEKEHRKKPEKERTRPQAVPPFSRKSDLPVTTQLRDAFEDAMKWHFTTFEQLQSLMIRRYNVFIELQKKDDQKDTVLLSGTSPSGLTVTPLLDEKDLGIELYRQIVEKCETEKMSSRKSQLERIEGLSRAAADAAGSYEEFRTIMEKKGVYTVISWSKDGKPFGLTWLDRATKCAWKGSETSSNLQWLKDIAEKKGWTITKDKYQSVVEKRRNMPSRKKEITRHEPKTAAPTSSGSTQKKPTVLDIGRIIGKGPVGQNAKGGGSEGKGRRKDLWDEALEAAELEEQERRKNEQNQNI